MTHFPHGAVIAAQKARERKQREEQEEEEMTNYSVDDLNNNWEFKIVRSETGAFRKPEVFQSMLQEELFAGWELVEKLDDRRVRLKRPRDARRKDATLPQGYDPYRTHYGGSTARISLILGIVFALLLTAGLAVLAMMENGGTDGGKPLVVSSIIMITLVTAVLIGVARAIRRR